jgi:hypothetical protein
MNDAGAVSLTLATIALDICIVGGTALVAHRMLSRQRVSARTWVGAATAELLASFAGVFVGLVCFVVTAAIMSIATEGLRGLWEFEAIGAGPLQWLASIVIYGCPFAAPAAGLGCWLFAESRRKSRRATLSLITSILGSFGGITVCWLLSRHFGERLSPGFVAVLVAILLSIGAVFGYRVASDAPVSRMTGTG